MESEGAIRILQRLKTCNNLCYNEYYGDEDSKSYSAVKDIYTGTKRNALAMSKNDLCLLSES